MKDVAIILVSGFEDAELVITVDVLSRNGLSYDIFSAEGNIKETGKYNSQVIAKPITQMDNDNYKSIFLPGGSMELSKNTEVNKKVVEFANENKMLFAICAAPIILWNNNILKNKKFTCWPGLKLKDSTNSEVEVDGNIITARDYRSTFDFVDEMVKKITK